MSKIAVVLTEYLIKKDIIDTEEKDFYIYGFEITIYTILSTTGLLIVGILCHRLISSIIMISIFYLCQSYGGGYHAKTHTRCFLIMCVGLLLGFFIENLSDCTLLYPIIGIVSVSMLFFRPLILHKNKRYLLSQTEMLRKKSRWALLVSVIASTVAITIFALPISTFAVAYLLSCISRYCAKLSN